MALYYLFVSMSNLSIAIFFGDKVGAVFFLLFYWVALKRYKWNAECKNFC